MKSLLERLLDRIAARIAAGVVRQIPAPEPPPVRLYGDCPNVSASVHTIYLTQGQTLTVFAGAHRSLDSDPPYQQIELQTSEDGEVTVFADDLQVLPYSDAPIYRPRHP